MRRILFAAFLALAAPPAHAQVEVTCRLPHDTVCAYEPLMATVRIRNHAGVPLVFDGENTTARFGFYVTDSSMSLLSPRTNAVLSLPSGVDREKEVTFTNNLALLFDLRKPGAYTVQSWVEWSGQTFYSPQRYVDVAAGVEVARVQASLPGPEGGFRQYTLLSLQRDRGQSLLFRVDDAQAGLCHGVFDLGRFVNMRPPELTIDAGGYAHILHQASPMQYLYSVFDPNGEKVDGRDYGNEYGSVHMKTEDGRVAVEVSAASQKPADAQSPMLQPLPRMR
jgi:hypothetical protein